MITQYEKDYMNIVSSCFKIGAQMKNDDGQDIYSIKNKTLNIDITTSVPIPKSNMIDTKKCISTAIDMLNDTETYSGLFDHIKDGRSDSYYAVNTSGIPVSFNIIPGKPVPYLYGAIFVPDVNCIDIADVVFTYYVFACLIGRYTKTRPMTLTFLFGSVEMNNADVDLFAQQEDRFKSLLKLDFTSYSYNSSYHPTEEEGKIYNSDPVIRIKNVTKDMISTETVIVDSYSAYKPLGYGVTPFGEKVIEAVASEESKGDEADG